MAVNDRRPSGLAALAAASLLLAGCTGQEIYVKEDVQSVSAFSTWVDSKPVYRIGPGDSIAFKFLLTPDMDEEVLVGPDGTVGLRTAGQVEIGGLTPREAEQKVMAAARRYLQDPIVTVQVKSYTSSRVFVGGAVNGPGAYLVPGPTTALEAIVNAGGFKEDARPDEIVLIRRGPDGKPMMRTIDVQNFIQRLDPEDDVMLMAGDVIIVPRSIVGEIGHWVEQYIDNVLPFDPSFDYTIQRSWSTSTGRTVPPL